jgi:two-component system sensor histidine kinase/response regulator
VNLVKALLLHLPYPTQMIKVLLVEDEVALRETLEEILELNDFDVKVAGSGEEALEIINTWIPDLFVSDIMMPGITGYDLIRKVHEQSELAEIPFIFLSALASREDQNKGIEAGAKGYITKPFKSAELIALIKQYISAV